MKAKWYLSTLIVILTFLGFSQQQKDLPNQEIIVEFANDNVSADVAKNAIANVQKQLLTLGVANIHIRQSVNGSLKITYYSEIDVASIEKLFSTEQALELDYSLFDENKVPIEFPSEEGPTIYKLNVCEIGSGSDFESDFNGYILELRPEADRLLIPIVYHSFKKIDSEEKNKTEKTAYKLHRSIAVTIDNSSYIIPEVRAGPRSYGKA